MKCYGVSHALAKYLVRGPCWIRTIPLLWASFGSETHPTVRIEACETCRRYVKSIDLTVDARAIPEVDDLVSVGMDLGRKSRATPALRRGWRGSDRGLLAGAAHGRPEGPAEPLR